MDSAREAHMTPSKALSELFADYRAEWPQPYFSSLFVPPPYFAKLETARPCLLIGGRGTGKTIALKSLRFDAAEARARSIDNRHERAAYLGLYIRVNKNRVRAFNASEIDPETRDRAFAHYFNVLVGQELCRLTLWLESQGRKGGDALDAEFISASFGVADATDLRSLAHALDKRLLELELWVNNGGIAIRPVFSMPEAPLRQFATMLQNCGLLDGQQIYCCVDEYENFSEEQQSIVNTYLKHSEPPLSFKIGVRRDGLHTRNTIDKGDQIATPDDYVEIDIAIEGFEDFAVAVLRKRLGAARETDPRVPDAQDFLPELTFEEEARLLGCERIAEEVQEAIAAECPSLSEWAMGTPSHRLYFLRFWQVSMRESLCALALDWQKRPDHWETRIGNYGYASLFWLSRGRKGARIRKYYTGVNTFVSLASGNIRYFLELIDSAINYQFDEGFARQEVISIDPKAQTLAARAVGKRRLDQLEGLSERGVELKRLVLAIGKVFFELARDPAGRAPEQNSFILGGNADERSGVEPLLRNGVAHLAFEATPRTKSTSPELREEEYRLHPIFCPFFEYSHRRKRRITISAGSLLKLNSNPGQAIAEMLGVRQQVADVELPEQLAMFTDFFHGEAA